MEYETNNNEYIYGGKLENALFISSNEVKSINASLNNIL